MNSGGIHYACLLRANLVLAGALFLAVIVILSAFFLGAADFLRGTGRALEARGFGRSGLSRPVVAASLPSVPPTILAAAVRNPWLGSVFFRVIFPPLTCNVDSWAGSAYRKSGPLASSAALL